MNDIVDINKTVNWTGKKQATSVEQTSVTHWYCHMFNAIYTELPFLWLQNTHKKTCQYAYC